MKALCRVGLAALVVAAAGLVVAGGGEQAEKAYECAVCSALEAEMGDLHARMTMGIAEVEQGAVLVATAQEADAREIQAACAKFTANLKAELAKPAGERKLCPFCSSLAKLQEMGITLEHLPTRYGEVDLLTATTEAQRAAIREFVAMHKEMMAAHHAEGA